MEIWIIVGVIVLAFLLCFLLAIANYSGERFMDKYNEMNKIEAETRLSPLQYIQYIEDKYFKGKMEVVQISNVAGDAYSNGKLFLSGNTIQLNSLASFTIISHEMGHALQDEEGGKLKRLNRLRKFGRFLGVLLMPSIIAGIILLFFGGNLFIAGIGLISLGVLIFILALIIKIITISIEKDASKKAMVFLSEILGERQLKKCKKFLNDARLTYWAEFLRIILGWTGGTRKSKLFN
jgi:hypothetical protein